MKRMDVQSAFLHGDVDKRILVELPEIIYDEGYRKKYVGHLRKALYSLRQAPLLWCEKLSVVLISLGYTRCKIGACVYVKLTSTKIYIVAFYVYDLLICRASQQAVEETTEELARSFTMTDIGTRAKMIGWNMKIDKNKVIVTQEKFIQRLKEKYLAFC
jgi:Reverse transcriptase (RNA-dependent DNA polymerase)